MPVAPAARRREATAPSLAVPTVAALAGLLLGLLVAAPVPASASASAEPADTSPPVLTSFEFSPETVAVEGAAQDVVVTVDLTDETGARAPTIDITSDSTDESHGFGSMTLVSGTDRDGTWQRVVTIPAGAERGSWTVTLKALVDVLEHSDETIRDHPDALDVTGDPPVLVDFDFTPTTVNVADSAQDVVVSARITDHTGARAPTVELRSDTTDQLLGFGSMTLVSGPDTEKDGIWARTVTIPSDAATGAWTVRIYALEDVLDNSDNTIRHHPTKLTVTTTTGPSPACTQAEADEETAAALVSKYSAKLTRAKKQLKSAKQQLRKAKATGKKAKIKRAKAKVSKARTKVRTLAKKRSAAQTELDEARERVALTC